MTSTTADAQPPDLPPPPATPASIGRLASPRWATRLGVWVTVDDEDRMRWATVVSGIVAAIVVVSAVLGRIPYTLPKPNHYLGFVSPTSGMTRGAVAITRGHFALAYHYHPLSFLVPIALLAIVVRVVVGRSGRGRWVNVMIHPTKVMWIVVAVLFAAGLDQPAVARPLPDAHAPGLSR